MRTVTVKGDVLKRTDLAILILSEELNDEIWIPLSVCEEVHSNPNTKGEDRLEVAEWWARKNGL